MVVFPSIVILVVFREGLPSNSSIAFCAEKLPRSTNPPFSRQAFVILVFEWISASLRPWR